MSFGAKLIVLNGKTAGKDKIYRTVQYGCKLIWYLLWKNKSNKDYIEVLKKIESAMSNTRKVFRLAKTHDMIDAALNSIHLDDYFLRIIITSSNVNQACYLLLDNLLWLNSVGALEIKKRLKSMNDWSNKFWLFSTLLYLARDFHDLFGLLKIEEEDENNSKKYDPVNSYSWNKQSGSYTKSNLNNFTTRSILKRIFKKLKIIILNKNYHPLLLDTIKNIFDVFLPLSNLNFINISPGLQGLCGLISSIVSLVVIWDAKYKLKP